MHKWSKTQWVYHRFIKFIGFSQDRTTRNLFRLFQVASFFVLIIFCINLLSIKYDKAASFGQFGDFFGGVLNPILTFLMFMGVLITIVLQQKELKLTRHELSKSSKAMVEQATTQENILGSQMLTAKIHALSTVIESVNVDIKINSQKITIFYNDLNTDNGQEIQKQLHESIKDVKKYIDERVAYRNTIETLMMGMIIKQSNSQK